MYDKKKNIWKRGRIIRDSIGVYFKIYKFINYSSIFSKNSKEQIFNYVALNFSFDNYIPIEKE